MPPVVQASLPTSRVRSRRRDRGDLEASRLDDRLDLCAAGPRPDLGSKARGASARLSGASLRADWGGRRAASSEPVSDQVVERTVETDVREAPLPSAFAFQLLRGGRKRRKFRADGRAILEQ
jgi:hypothetical protein